MKKRTLIVALFVLPLVLISAIARAEVVTDNFDDGDIGEMWVIQNDSHGTSFAESSGSLNITGTATAPCDWYGGKAMATLFDGTTAAEAEVKLKIPAATGESGISLVMVGPKGRLELHHNTSVGYALIYRSPTEERWSSWLGKMGDEDTVYYLLKLAYDPVTHSANAYVCDADGSNPRDLDVPGDFDTGIDLGSSVGVNKKLSVNLFYWTNEGTTINVNFDDFKVTAGAYPELVAPPLASDVLPGDRQDFEPGSVDLVFPSFSHDGKKLAYLKRDDPTPSNGIWNIYIRDLTPGATPIKITADTHYPSIDGPTWSPDNSRIFFVTDERYSTEKLAYIDLADTPNPTLHPYLSEFDIDNDWFGSVDFSRVTEDGTYYTAVYTKGPNIYTISVEADGDVKAGATPLQITNLFRDENYINGLKWAPDRTKITCNYVLSQHSSAIWIIDYAGLIGAGQTIEDENSPYVTVITDTRNFAATPHFTLTGDDIYFCVDILNRFIVGETGWIRYNDCATMTGNADFELCTAKADGSTPPERLMIAPLSQGILSGSPDGTMLAYNTDDETDTDDDGAEVRDADIYIQQLVVSETIPTTGGDVTDGSGTTVTVPDGALTEEETITIRTPLPTTEPAMDTFAEDVSLTTTREFGPDELTFSSPVTLDMHYTNEEVAGLNETGLEVYTYNELQAVWEALPTVSHDLDNNVITTQTDHFSTFGVLGKASRAPQFLRWVPSFGITSAPELARAGINYGNNRVMAQVKDASTDIQIKQVFFTLDFTPISLAVLPDFTGTSVPELACLGRRASDGCNLADVRDASSGALLKRVYFHAEFLPYDMEWMPDFGRTSAPELVTLARRPSDTAIMGAKRDASSRFLVNPRTWFIATFLPVDIEVMGDFDGNGVAELVSLQRRVSDSQIISEVRDASTNVLLQRVWYDNSYYYRPLDVEVVSDFGGDTTAPEVAMLRHRPDDDSVAAEVRDASTGTLISTVAFSSEYMPLDLEVVPDFGGGSTAPELVVLGHRESDHAVIGQIKDASTDALIGTVSFSSTYRPKGIQVLSSFDGTGAPELAVHGVDPSDGAVIGEVKDASSGALLQTCTFSSFFVIP